MTTPTQAAPTTIPADVLRALDRMCTPLHESRLAGATAEADAHCMKIIRDYIFAASEARDMGKGCTPADARMLRAANHGLADENAALREALQFYADGSHFVRVNEDVWDTCSGEPTNFWFDEAETAQIEDGSLAKAALDKHSGDFGGNVADAEISDTMIREFFDSFSSSRSLVSVLYWENALQFARAILAFSIHGAPVASPDAESNRMGFDAWYEVEKSKYWLMAADPDMCFGIWQAALATRASEAAPKRFIADEPEAWDHELKTDPAVFEAVLNGSKTHEIRYNDRGFKIADRLRLRETEHTGQEMRGPEPLPLIYTGRECSRTVSHVLDGYGLQPGWVILSFEAAPVAVGDALTFDDWISKQTFKRTVLGESDLRAAWDAGALKGKTPITKEWCLNMARLEGDSEIGACDPMKYPRIFVDSAEPGEPLSAELQKGTFACPICEKATPHKHSGTEIVEHRNALKSIARAKALNDAFYDIRDWVKDDVVAQSYVGDMYRTRLITLFGAHETLITSAALASQAAPATTAYDPEFVRNKFADYETQILNLREELAARRGSQAAPVTQDAQQASVTSTINSIKLSAKEVSETAVAHFASGKSRELCDCAGCERLRSADSASDAAKDCPHASPFRYCPVCPVSPCPIGLGDKK